jgi:APA family basic amino acid/polyamine antiporter
LEDSDDNSQSNSSKLTALKLQLNLFDAIASRLAAILGAEIFSVIAPAARVAGRTLLVPLLIAAFVVFCNAISSAQRAINFARAGGTYTFGNRLVGK